MKVVIDSFNTEEQAVAFVDWFKKQSDLGKVQILTTVGNQEVQYDGVDLSSGTKDQLVMNICVDYITDYTEDM